MTSGAEIALISGGWTALVGVAGFGAAILTNSRTIKAARQDKISDERAAVYVDLLSAITWRRTKRSVDTYTLDPKAVDLERTRRLVDDWQQPDWHLLEARMAAFGTTTVFSAAQRSSTAYFAAMSAYTKLLAIDDFKDAAMKAQKDADDADDALAGLIRQELIGKDAPLPGWELPASAPFATF
jgi:hypothetical protein